MRILLLLSIFTGLACESLENAEERGVVCRIWRDDYSACKDEECCERVRDRRPHACWPRSREDQPDLCAVSK
jgi:hypothetical protein